MIRSVIRLMEILSFLYTLASVYNLRMKYNIYAVIFIISEILLLSGINDYGYSTYLLGFSYLLMFIYCLLNYKSGIKETLVNCVIVSVTVSIIQMLCYFMVTFVAAKSRLTVIQREVLVSTIYFAVILLFSNKLHLYEISRFFMKRNRLLNTVAVSVLLILGSQIWRIKRESIIDGRIIFFSIYFVLLLILLTWEWQKTRSESDKRKAQLEVDRIYFNAYEDLIQTIRERQHDFKNHLNALEGMLYSIDNYEELVTEQRKYLQNIIGNTEQTKLLTLIENPLIAGFLNSKISKAEKAGIDVKYNCILPKREMLVPEFQIIEMMGILLDNSIEALQNEKNKILNIKLLMEENRLKFAVTNTFCEKNIDISRLFERGYSSKGKNRGIGLYKLKHMVEENNGAVCVSQETIANMQALKIEWVINV